MDYSRLQFKKFIISRCLAALAVLLITCAANQSRAACQLARIAELPVTVIRGQPLTTASINGTPAVFLVDSGAFFSQITPAKAAEFNLRVGPAPFGLGAKGVGGVEKLSMTTVKTFTIVGSTLKDIEFLVGGSETGQDTAGLLGRNFLSIADAEFDLAKGSVKLIHARGCGRLPLAYWDRTGAYSTLDLIEDGGVFHSRIRAEVFVNGVRMRAMFDTGAGKSLLTTQAARRAGIDVGGPGVRPAGLDWGVGRHRIPTWIAPVASFKIGDEEVHHTHLRFGEMDLDGVDMLLGEDFFLSHHVFVANSQARIYFTYNGGPVFDLTTSDTDPSPDDSGAPPPAAVATSGPQPAPAGPAPAPAASADAAALAREGAAFTSRGETARAIDSLGRAVALAPGEPRYLFERALAYLAAHQPVLAKADLDKGLALDPRDIPALTARAELEFSSRDKAHGLADLDAIDRLAARQADVRLTLARAYEAADALAPALAQYDLWIAAHPEDSHQALALSGRCTARVLAGLDLGKALADCDAALRLEPRLPGGREARGMAHLRLGHLDRALADFEAALAERSTNAWALYGRGVIRIRQGQSAAGRADIAAATALRPNLPAEAKSHGLGPDGPP